MPSLGGSNFRRCNRPGVLKSIFGFQRLSVSRPLGFIIFFFSPPPQRLTSDTHLTRPCQAPGTPLPGQIVPCQGRARALAGIFGPGTPLAGRKIIGTPLAGPWRGPARALAGPCQGSKKSGQAGTRPKFYLDFAASNSAGSGNLSYMMARRIVLFLAAFLLAIGSAQVLDEPIEIVIAPWDFLDSPRPIYDDAAPGVSRRIEFFKALGATWPAFLFFSFLSSFPYLTRPCRFRVSIERDPIPRQVVWSSMCL